MPYNEKLFQAGKSTQNGFFQVKKYDPFEKSQVTKELKRGEKHNMGIEKKAMACLWRALGSILPFVSFSLLISSILFSFLVIFIPFITKPRNLGEHIHCFSFLKHFSLTSSFTTH